MNTNEMKKKVKWDVLLAALLIPLFVGVFSAYLTNEDMKLYGSFNHPVLAPPAWVFPIVWTILYVMMGVASYLVYMADAGRDEKNKALQFYAGQLAMNLFWSTLFFTYKRYLLSLIWLLIMWVMVMICAARFLRIRRAAGIMMGVLFLWTTFAAYLNLAYYVMSITPAAASAL